MIGTEVVQRTSFDYNSLDIEMRIFVLEKAATIQARLKRTAEDIVAIGQELIEVKERLPLGTFESWLRDEFDMSQRSAERFMQVSERFKDSPVVKMAGTPSVLYALVDSDETIIQKIESGEILPTLSAIREAKQTFNPIQHGMGQSKVVAWNTPSAIVDEVEEMLGEIDVDPASNSKDTPNVPATMLYTEDDDGLSQLWKGRVFLNPPYGREIGEWIVKLVQEYEDGNVEEAIALVPGRTDTQWFRALFNYPLCFISGRVRYSNGAGAAPFPSVLVYMGTRIEDFISVFKHHGPIMKRMSYEY